MESQKQEEEHKRQDNKRTKEATAHSIKDDVQKIGHELKFHKNPKYIEERKKIFDELYQI